MALVNGTGIGEITGKLGRVVYRQVYGKTVAYERSEHYKAASTVAAKKFRKNFGMSVKLAQILNADPVINEVWTAAKIKGVNSNQRIIKNNIKLMDSGSLTDRNKITPDGLFLKAESAALQNDVLHLSLVCPADNNLVFPANLSILYNLGQAYNPLVLTETRISESSADGLYELDIKPAASIVRILNENPDTLLFIALVSETPRKKKAYWTSTASVRLT